MDARSDAPFRQAIAWTDAPDGRAEGWLGEEWGQGRAIYGGLQGAAALAAMRALVPPDRQPRSLVATFAGPIAPGPVRCEATLVRSGRSASHCEARLIQDDQVRFTALASFGAPRPSAIDRPGAARPAAEPPEALPPMPYIAGVVPLFTRLFEHRWSRGQPPFTAARTAELAGWCRFRDPSGPGDAEAVLALVDAWPSPVLSLLDRATPASSVTWSVNFAADAGDARTDQWWFYESRSSFTGGGYSDLVGSLWAPDGRLVATTQQLVAIFA